MIDAIKILIGFVSGVTATIGLYVAVMQYRRSLPSLRVMATCCSFKLDDRHRHEYTCAFHLWLQNQTKTEYAVTDIQWRPKSRRLRDRIRGVADDGWQRLYFHGILDREHWSHSVPLLFGPYEHKHLVGYWHQMWTSEGHPPPEFWRECPNDATTFDRLVEALHDNSVIYQVTFADGRKLRYKGLPEHGS